MTDEEITAALAICEAATAPRPWSTCGAQDGAVCSCRLIWSGDHENTVVSASDEGSNMREQRDVATPADLMLVVAAVNGYEPALAEVQRLRKHVAHNDEEYATMKDVLRAEHEACKQLRSALSEACDLYDYALRIEPAIEDGGHPDTYTGGERIAELRAVGGAT